jgi:hypothetical protein
LLQSKLKQLVEDAEWKTQKAKNLSLKTSTLRIVKVFVVCNAIKTLLHINIFIYLYFLVGLRPLAYCGRGFESHRGHGCLSAVCVVCCQVEVSVTSWSLVHRSPTNCGASLCVITKPRERGGHSPRWAAEPEKIILIISMLKPHQIVYPLLSVSMKLETENNSSDTNVRCAYILEWKSKRCRTHVQNIVKS